MADIQDNQFPEARDKMVHSVELVSTVEGFGISIRFYDESTLYFGIESRIVASPVHSQWNKGEETVLKRWQAIQSVSSDS